MVTGLIVGSMKNRNICIAMSNLWIKNWLNMFVSIWICTGVDEAGGVWHGPVSVMPCVCVCVWYSWNEQLPSLVTQPAPDTPPNSSCEKTQFCLCLPKRNRYKVQTRSSVRDGRSSPRSQRRSVEMWSASEKRASFRNMILMYAVTTVTLLAWD